MLPLMRYLVQADAHFNPTSELPPEVSRDKVKGRLDAIDTAIMEHKRGEVKEHCNWLTHNCFLGHSREMFNTLAEAVSNFSKYRDLQTRS